MKIKPGIAISTDGVSEEDQRVFVDLCVMNGGKKRINESFPNKNFIAWGVTTNNIYFCDSIDTNHTLVSIDQITEALDKPHFDFSRRPDSGKNYWHERGELPPVGTECEIAASTEYLKIGYPEGTKVKIYANFTDDRGIKLAAFVDSIGKVGGVATAKCFRPLKTERERAIEEMVAVIKSVPEYNDFGVAETLYDAGFRKEGK